MWGSQIPEQWSRQAENVDFFDIKGDVESILALSLQSGTYSFVADVHPALQKGQSARIIRAGVTIGWIGALAANVQQKIDISGKIYLMELDLQSLEAAKLPVYHELSRYPSVRRDLAIVVDSNQEAGVIEERIKQEAGELLKEMLIFDVYQGQNIQKTKKSLALGLTFQHPSRTLTDEEINSIIDNCIKVLEAQFNAELRM